jgi:hypothetical protein
MPTGNDCPVCGENIGMWAVFRAPLPNRIYCPHCRERLRYGDTDLLIGAAVVSFALVAGFALWATYESGAFGPAAIGILLGTLILGLVAVEIVFVLALWYGSFRLESVNRPPDEWDDAF